MKTVLQSKIIAKAGLAMMLCLGAASSWSTESYGFLSKVLTGNNQTFNAQWNYNYVTASNCSNYKGCGKIIFKRTSKGKYLVDITAAGVAGRGMDFQVIAVGTDSARCKFGGDTFSQPWGAWGVRFPVVCHDVKGNLVDSKFLVSTIEHLLRREIGARKSDYMAIRVNKNGDAYQDGHGNFQNHSPREDLENTPYTAYDVAKVGSGQYVISIPGWLPSDVNSVRLTAVGTDSNFCTFDSYVRSTGRANEVRMRVNCFNNAGSYSDTKFNLLVEKDLKGPTGRGGQYTLANKRNGAWTNWDFKRTALEAMRLSFADYNSKLMVSHKHYSERLGFPFVTSLMPRKYCKIASYTTRVVGSTDFLDVKMGCYEANKGLDTSPATWQFSQNLVSIN